MNEEAFKVYMVGKELEEKDEYYSAINHYLSVLKLDRTLVGAYNRIEEILPLIGESMDTLIQEVDTELGTRLEGMRNARNSFDQLSSLLKSAFPPVS